MFADASKIDENGQISVICGLLTGDIRAESVVHLIMWMSHKSRRSVKIVPAPEVLAAAEIFYEAKCNCWDIFWSVPNEIENKIIRGLERFI